MRGHRTICGTEGRLLRNSLARLAQTLARRKMHRELFQKQYDFELDQRNALISAVNVPIVAITVLTSAASAALLDFPYQLDVKSWVFLLLCLLGFAALLFAVYSGFRSFWGYEYQKLPDATQLRSHFEGLCRWHENCGNSPEDAKASALLDFADYLDERLAEAVEWNSKNNLARGNYVHRATAAIAFALMFFLPSAGIYVYTKATAEERLYRVRLVPPESIEKDQQMPTPSTPDPAPAPSPPPTEPAAPASAPAQFIAKPIGPPNTNFKSGMEMPIPGASSTGSKE